MSDEPRTIFGVDWVSGGWKAVVSIIIPRNQYDDLVRDLAEARRTAYELAREHWSYPGNNQGVECATCERPESAGHKPDCPVPKALEWKPKEEPDGG